MINGPLYFETWEDNLRWGTVLRLHDDVHSVETLVTMEEQTNAADPDGAFLNGITRLCCEWKVRYGDTVIALPGREGVPVQFEVVGYESHGDYIDGEVVSVHEVRELTDGR